jgi:anti-sigma-K factor RskA
LDVKKYIESGIIDDYLMGFVSEQERQEVQCLSKIYPEINEVLRSSENIMSTWAADFSEAPPAHLRAKILDNLPPQEDLPKQDPTEQKEDKSILIDFSEIDQDKDESPKVNYWSYAAAIAFIFGALMVWQWQSARSNSLEMKDEMLVQQEQMEDLKNNYEEMASTMQLKDGLLAVVSDPDVQKIVLGPAKEDMNANSAMYWNKVTQKAYFHRLALPAEPSDSQYQLWAIVDGKPQSLGMVSLEENVAWQELSTVEGAQAFAITLEPMGGSESPTLENMMVIGTVS